MTEKEVTLKIQADVDDSQVQDLESLLQQIVDGKITIPIETDLRELEEVESRIEELQQVQADIYMGVDDTSLEEVEAELSELEARQLELTVDADTSGVDDVKSSVEDLENEIENVNNTSVSPQGDTSGVDNVKDSVSGLEEALTAATAGVSLAGMEQLVATAGNINDSWNRLGLTFDEVTSQMKTDMSEAGEATGRSGGLIRGFFNDMGMAGIQNTELLQQSFEALSGRAYQTGTSIESLEQKVKMMVMSGNAGSRQLTQLGITTDDLGRVMGVSADEASKMFKSLSQDERLRVLTQAMGDGKQANEMYKNSWQGLKDQVDKATGAFMGLVGNAVLPLLVPAMKTLTSIIESLSAGFNALPAPIQGVIGGVLALVMGFLAITTVISVLRTLESTLQLVTTAQSILNVVAAMNPYVLVAIAIIALIAALWYLYNTNEQVRAAIDGFGQALLGLGEAIYNGISGAIQWLIDSFTWLWETISNLFNSTGAEGTNWLTTMIMVLMGPIGWIMLLIQNWDSIGPAVSGALSSMYQNAVNWFNQTGARIHTFASDLVSTVGGAAWNAVSSFASGISGLAGALQGELDRMLSAVADWSSQLIQRFWQAAVDAVNALKRGLGIGSPGFMYYMVEGEINRIDDLAKNTDMPSSFGTLGSNMVNSFNPNFNNGAISGAGTVINNEFNFTFTDFIDDKERLTDLIVKTITDEINWNNNTAGRNV